MVQHLVGGLLALPDKIPGFVVVHLFNVSPGELVGGGDDVFYRKRRSPIFPQLLQGLRPIVAVHVLPGLLGEGIFCVPGLGFCAPVEPGADRVVNGVGGDDDQDGLVDGIALLIGARGGGGDKLEHGGEGERPLDMDRQRSIGDGDPFYRVLHRSVEAVAGHEQPQAERDQQPSQGGKHPDEDTLPPQAGLHFLQPLRHGGVLVRPIPGGGGGRLLQGVVGLLAGGAVFQVLLHQGGGVGGAHPVHVQGQQVLDDLTGDFHSNSSFSFSRARW